LCVRASALGDDRDRAARRQRRVGPDIDGALRELQPEDVALDQLEDQRLHDLTDRQRRTQRSRRIRERDDARQLDGVHGIAPPSVTQSPL
jgi:hypothetical protein